MLIVSRQKACLAVFAILVFGTIEAVNDSPDAEVKTSTLALQSINSCNANLLYIFATIIYQRVYYNTNYVKQYRLTVTVLLLPFIDDR